MSVDNFSAKVRAEGVNDERADLSLDVWAGVVPITAAYGTPEPDQELSSEIAVPPSVKNLAKVAPK